MSECHLDNSQKVLDIYGNYEILLVTLFVLASLFVCFLVIFLIKKRNYFPLKERSPILSVFALLSFYISRFKLVIPILIYNHSNNIFQHDHRKQTLIFFALGFFGFINFLVCQSLKSIRLVLAVNQSKLKKWILIIFRNEWYLCVISATISIIAASICIYIQVKNCWNFKIGEIYAFNYGYQFLQQNSPANIYLCMFFELIFIICTYFIRNLKSEYSLISDQIQMIIFLIVQQILSLLMQTPDVSSGETITYFLIWLIFFMFCFLQYALPLYKSQKYHTRLQASTILDNFELFISQENCVDIFTSFLEEYTMKLSKENDKIINDSDIFVHSLFKTNKILLFFYFHVEQGRIINNNDISIEFSRQTIKKFKNYDEVNIFEYLHQSGIVPKFLESPNENDDDDDDNYSYDNNKRTLLPFQNINQPIGVLLFYYEYAKKYLFHIYQTSYTMTFSYCTLQKVLLFNEKVDDNLTDLRMIES